MRPHSSLETLEDRIAPAVLAPAVSADGRSATWTDVDGDTVTLKITKGTLELTPGVNLTFLTTPGGSQLQELNLTAAEFKGTAITFSAVRSAVEGGDGLVNLGYLNASGQTLGAVTISGDLAKISAGAAVPTARTVALASLSVGSMGLLSDSTLNGGGALKSDVSGKIGILTVKGSIKEAFLEVSGGVLGSIGTLSIGDSLIGLDTADTGRIVTSGAISKISVKGSIVGGAGQRSGAIETGGNATSVVIGGSIFGGKGATPENDGSGVLRIAGKVTALTVGNVIGGTQQGSGLISISGDASTVTVKGSVVGGSEGTDNGAILIGGSTNALTLSNGSVLGGAADNSGVIAVAAVAKKLSIKGLLKGGDGDGSGRISVGSSVADAASVISIAGDIQGGVGANSGRITATNVTTLSVLGSIYGGTGNQSGSVGITGKLGTGKVTGLLVGGDLADSATADLSGSGAMVLNQVATLDLGGIRTGIDYSGIFDLVNSAAVRVANNIGKLNVRGNIEGVGETRALITTRGQAVLVQDSIVDVALGSVTVLGSVVNADLLAGYNTNTNFTTAGINPNAQIGTVTVAGSWTASNLVAGVAYNDTFGDGTDVKIVGVDSPNIVASINSITIKGAILGTADAGDNYGFLAQRIDSFKFGAKSTPVVLNTGSGDDNTPFSPQYNFGSTKDTYLFEVSL